MEPIEVHAANEGTGNAQVESKENFPKFKNDFTSEDKARIKEEVAKKVEEVLAQSDLSINNLAHLTFVSRSVIKSRSEIKDSAREIVLDILNGVTAPRKPAVNTNSVKSFLASLSPEEKAKLLAEIA